MKNFIKKFIVPIITIIVAVILTAVYFIAIMPKATDGEKSVVINLNYKENEFEYKVKTDANTVLELLLEVDEVYDIGIETASSIYGEYVTSLKGVSEDVENGYYYSYKIEGVEFANGISIQTIKDGDVITFEYGKSTYDENFNLIDFSYQGKGQTSNIEKLQVAFICISSVLVLTAVLYGVIIIIKGGKNGKV